MPYIQPSFATGHFYHVYNRGVAKQEIFQDERDYRRLLTTFQFYLESTPENKLSALNQTKEFRGTLAKDPAKPLVEIHAYCLMPNHFHLLLRQQEQGGVSTFMSRSLNSYTRYCNTRRTRVGSMFQGTFRAVHVSSDEQLLHVSRYIHLNPVVARLSRRADEYPWSSHNDVVRGIESRLCRPSLLIQLAGGSQTYQEFCEDYLGYAQELALIKDKLIDQE